MDSKSCGIVRAKSPIDGSLVGTVIISRSDTMLARWMPVLSSSSSSSSYSHVNSNSHTNPNKGKGKEKEEKNSNTLGGILAPVIPSNNPQRETILQGLVMLSIRQNKNKGDGKGVVLNWVVGSDRDVLLGMGFDVLEAWEEVVCKVERVSLF